MKSMTGDGRRWRRSSTIEDIDGGVQDMKLRNEELKVDLNLVQNKDYKGPIAVGLKFTQQIFSVDTPYQI